MVLWETLVFVAAIGGLALMLVQPVWPTIAVGFAIAAVAITLGRRVRRAHERQGGH
jgi:hypothetical protein